MPPSSSGFESGDGGASPLWREPAFGFTFVLFGVAAALLPIAARPVPVAWPGAALVLLGLLAVADLGTASPMDARGGALRSVRFATGAAVVPMLVGLAAAAVGMSPGGRMALLLLGAGALFSLAAIAPLEVAPPPDDEEGPRVVKSRAPLAAGAALSFATAPFAQPYLDGTVHRLVSDPNAGAWLLAAFILTLLFGALVATTGLVGGAVLRQLRYRSFRAPRAAAAALLLAASGGIAAAGWAWF
ncbi:MAG TPA: hypothetical protein VNE71_07255 [Myxococcota bacterium]|jgi:hypothetical protein|nr:hypothetical protein [Myxococcota bacterium]